MAGRDKYRKCVAISTQAAIRERFYSAVLRLSLLTPIIGVPPLLQRIFLPEVLGGLLPA
jgi:Na+/H+-translocating membrane pyrophosphatase